MQEFMSREFVVLTVFLILDLFVWWHERSVNVEM
jgi:hypothetical protein